MLLERQQVTDAQLKIILSSSQNLQSHTITLPTLVPQPAFNPSVED